MNGENVAVNFYSHARQTKQCCQRWKKIDIVPAPGPFDHVILKSTFIFAVTQTTTGCNPPFGPRIPFIKAYYAKYTFDPVFHKEASV